MGEDVAYFDYGLWAFLWGFVWYKMPYWLRLLFLWWRCIVAEWAMLVARLYCAVHCFLMLSLQFFYGLNLCFTALNKGGGPSAEEGRYLLLALYIRGGG